MPNQTGPRTPEGKARSSRNATRHGLTSARLFVLPNEDEEAWNENLASWTLQLQPRSECESQIVLDIAQAQWRLRRVRTLETDIFRMKIAQRAERMAELWTGKHEDLASADAFKWLSDTSRVLENLHRYESRARRAFERGIAALSRLRALGQTAPDNAVEIPVQPDEQKCKNEMPSAPPPTPPEPLLRELEAHRRRDPLFDPVLDASQMSAKLRRWYEKQAA